MHPLASATISIRRQGATLLCAWTCIVALGCDRPPEPGDPISNGRVIGSIGDSPGRFLYPRAVEISSNGLWVIDRSGRVQRLDPKTGYCTGLFRMPQRDLGMPTGLFVGPGLDQSGKPVDELLYIADTHYHRVVVVRPPPLEPIDQTRAREFPVDVVRMVGAFGTGPGQFYYPTDVAVLFAPDGRTPERYYVSEYGGNDRVSIFDASWTFVKSFGTFGAADDSTAVHFHRPQSLAIVTLEGSTRVLVTDSVHHRVGVFSTEGDLVRWVGGKASGVHTAGEKEMPSTVDVPQVTSAGPVDTAVIGAPARFLYPYGVQWLGDTSVLVAEFGASRVQRVDVVTGVCLGSWGRPGRGPGELAVPWEVRAGDGLVYVLDSGNNRIIEFAAPVRGVRTGAGRVP